MTKPEDGARPDEGDLERWARKIVSESLGVPVDRYDDGLENGQVDAVIRTEAGPAPLEVVGDHDGAFTKTWNRLKANEFRFVADPEQPSWHVIVSRSAQLKKLEKSLPAQLASMTYADNPFDYPSATNFDSEDDYEERLRTRQALERHGVQWLAPIDGTGIIRASVEGWNSWEDPIEFLPWIPRILNRHPDKAAKLQRFGGAETHVFIWATVGKVWSVNSMLMQDDDDQPSMPQGAPVLPDGVTDVWIASTMSRRDCLHWSPRTQWERFEWEPDDESASLT
ncbi:hypothetical protein [Clavibacter tessellarius]|uniref:hypothetical protein n=1 Tax=Clavibacter tessellarius TaxID=31965 RepID=UPI0032503836